MTVLSFAMAIVKKMRRKKMRMGGETNMKSSS
jgi:hypothetical protein